MSEILGRKITHRRLSIDELKEIFLEEGLEPEYAVCMVNIQLEAARGTEEDIFNMDRIRKLLGSVLCANTLSSTKISGSNSQI